MSRARGSTRESTIVRAIGRALDRLQAEGHPVWWRKTHGNQYGKAGDPDFDIVWYGRAVRLEAKRPGEVPTRLQEARMRDIRQAGGFAAAVWSVEDVLRILERLRPEGGDWSHGGHSAGVAAVQ